MVAEPAGANRSGTAHLADVTGPSLDVLLSYAYHRSTDIASVRRAIGPDAILMLDSGAFTAHTRRRIVDIRSYAAWLTDLQGLYTRAATLDVIGDPVATRRNTDWLRDQGFDVDPVFTVGEDFGYLPDLAEQGHRLVCVGGIVGTSPTIQRPYLRAVVARAHPAGLGVHALGVGGPRLIRDTDTYSGDSSAPTQSPAFGAITVWTGENLTQVKVSNAAGLSKHRDWLTGLGLPLRDMLSGNVFDKERGPVRRTLIEAGLWAYVTGGTIMRHRRRMMIGDLPVGPRLLAAVNSNDVSAVIAVGHAIHHGEIPPSVRRALPKQRSNA